MTAIAAFIRCLIISLNLEALDGHKAKGGVALNCLNIFTHSLRLAINVTVTHYRLCQNF